jgi:hypothetical protein
MSGITTSKTKQEPKEKTQEECNKLKKESSNYEERPQEPWEQPEARNHVTT